jgi:PKHD-type hydroxylase
MCRILQLLTDAEIAECRRIAAAAQFVDGRITNPHMQAKQNEQLQYSVHSDLILRLG